MNKRARFARFAKSAETIPQGLTIVPAMITNTVQKTSTGSKPVTFHTLNAVCVGEKEYKIAFKHNGKATNDERERIDADRESVDLPTLTRGSTFHSPCLANAAGEVKPGDVVSLGLHSSWYEGRYTIKIAAVVMNKSGGNTFTVDHYRNVFAKVGLNQLPTMKNICEFTDEVDESNEAYVKRMFVVPMADMENDPVYEEICVMQEPEKTARFECSIKDSSLKTIGINMEDGQVTANMFDVVYVRKDKTVCTMRYRFNSRDADSLSMWGCFGVRNVSHWSLVASSLYENAKDFLVFGSTSLADLKRLTDNVGEDADSEDKRCEASIAYINAMRVDLAETVRRAGVPLSFSWVKSNLLSREKWDNVPNEFLPTQINDNWTNRVHDNAQVVVNVTDLNGSARYELENMEFPEGGTVEYFGVFSVHHKSVGKIKVDTETFSHEQKIEESGCSPVVVFLVFTPKSNKRAKDAAQTATESLASQEEKDNSPESHAAAAIASQEDAEGDAEGDADADADPEEKGDSEEEDE